MGTSKNIRLGRESERLRSLSSRFVGSRPLTEVVGRRRRHCRAAVLLEPLTRDTAHDAPVLPVAVAILFETDEAADVVGEVRNTGRIPG